jgi:hypothetical protein
MLTIVAESDIFMIKGNAGQCSSPIEHVPPGPDEVPSFWDEWSGPMVAANSGLPLTLLAPLTTQLLEPCSSGPHGSNRVIVITKEHSNAGEIGPTGISN